MNTPVPSGTAPPFSPDATEPDFLTLRDGSTVPVHIAGPGDREALADFFKRLSPESRWRRFLSLALPRPELIASLCDSSEPGCFRHLVRRFRVPRYPPRLRRNPKVDEWQSSLSASRR
jgi:hypothetical protein